MRTGTLLKNVYFLLKLPIKIEVHIFSVVSLIKVVLLVYIVDR
jgi:hypothetical protein